MLNRALGVQALQERRVYYGDAFMTNGLRQNLLQLLSGRIGLGWGNAAPGRRV
jgi:hypothetical protein